MVDILEYLSSSYQRPDFLSVDSIAREYLGVRETVLASTILCPVTQVLSDRVVLFNSTFHLGDDEDCGRFAEFVRSGDWDMVDSFNYIELDYCWRIPDSSPDNVVLWLYQRIRECWNAWLHHLYPDRRFHVYLRLEQEDDPDSEYVLGFRELGDYRTWNGFDLGKVPVACGGYFPPFKIYNGKVTKP